MQLVLSLDIGGAEKLVCDIVRRVDKRFLTSTVCCLDRIGHFGKELQQEGYQVYALNRKPGVDWRLIPRIKKIIQQEKIDIVHAHQYTPYFYGVLASMYCKFHVSFRRPQIVFTQHGKTFYPEKRKIKRMLVNPVLGFFTEEIVTISKDTKSSLIKYENFSARRIKVVYNGIDLNRFSPKIDPLKKKQSLGVSVDSRVIGIVARLNSVKNHAMLFRAFQQVLDHVPETYLLIIGDGPEEQKLKVLAQPLNIVDRVVFLGARSDVPELLQICDVFALPSFSEGTSVSLLEAMGAGLPAVVTRVGGNPEVIKEQESGYLVESDNDQEMAAMLIRLLQDEETRQRMGQAGQQRVQAMFSLDKMVNTYVDMYLKVSNTVIP